MLQLAEKLTLSKQVNKGSSGLVQGVGTYFLSNWGYAIKPENIISDWKFETLANLLYFEDFSFLASGSKTGIETGRLAGDYEINWLAKRGLV